MIKNLGRILLEYLKSVRERDLTSRANSGGLQVWSYLTLYNDTQPYLQSRLSLKWVRVFAQLRLTNKFVSYLTWNKIRFKLPSSKNCSHCEEQNGKFYHFLVACPFYNIIEQSSFPRTYKPFLRLCCLYSGAQMPL